MKNFLLLLILPLAFSCAYSPNTPTFEEDVKNHVLRVNPDGYLLPSNFALQSAISRDDKHILSKTDAETQMDTMLLSSVKLGCRKSELSCNELTSIKAIPSNILERIEKVKILVYVHGGLNSYKSTDKRLESQRRSIIDDDKDWHYPIYVSWPSDAPSTIAQHFFEVREGRKVKPWIGYVSFPFVAVEDFFTGIGKAPANVWDQLINDKDRFVSGNGYLSWGLSTVWKDAEYQFKKEFFEPERRTFFSNKPYTEYIDENIVINRSIYNNTGLLNQLESTFIGAVAPVRYGFGILWNGTLANNSWAMMKRRARSIANSNGQFNKHVREYVNGDGTCQRSDEDGKVSSQKGKSCDGSGIGYLFERIFELETAYADLDIELTLIGHSMGAIVINNILSRYNVELSETNALDSIVYMGAAVSTTEALEVIPPILRANPADIDFYNLTLNRVAEVAETHAYGFVPSGSLLISIDKYHDSPEHHLLRTFGSEVNVQSSLSSIKNAFKDLQGDTVTLKAFDKVQKVLPYRHGDFGDLLFWKCETWQIDDNGVERHCGQR